MLLEAHLIMKKIFLCSSILTNLAIVSLNKCLTILRSAFLGFISLVLLLNSCGPGNTNNHYEAGKSGVSGGGATKDPGDGTGGATGDGGGGQGVLCGETTNTRIKNQLFVRDIFEAINNANLQMKNVPGTQNDSTLSQEAIRVLVTSIRSYFGPSSESLEFTHEEFWKNFISQISFIDDSKQLIPSNDANSPIALPNECRLVQIAYWDESTGATEDGTLYVNGNFWKKLDPLNKIGLLAHEFFFKQARKSKYTNSDFTRNKVGKLLSVEGLSPLFQDWEPALDGRVKNILPKSMTGFKICEGTSKDDPSARLKLYQYEGKNKVQHFAFPQLTSKIINANLLQPSNFSFIPDSNIRLTTATDLLTYRSDFFDSKIVPEYHRIKGPWLNWWYGHSGLLTKYFISTPQLLANSSGVTGKPVVWQENISAPKLPIKVILLDPAISENQKKQKEVKSQAELIHAVNERIRLTLKVCQSFTAPVTALANALSILNNEVSAAAQAEVYPSNFAKWNNSLKELGRYTDKKELEGWIDQNNCEFANDARLTFDLPYLLYTIKLNAHSDEEAIKVLGEDAYIPTNEGWTAEGNALPLPKLTVSQDGESLSFDLKCRDYATIFSETVKRISAPKKINLPNSSLKVTFADDSKKRRGWDANKVQDAYTSLAEYIRTEPFEPADISNPSDQTLKCQTPSDFENFPCEDYNFLLSEISNEREITLTRCQENIINADGNLYCALLRTESGRNKYVIHFTHGPDASSKSSTAEVTKILFVRLIQ
jgi:hypothetical protein